MKKQCNDLMNQADYQVADATLRTKVLTAAIALAVVDTLSLPSGQVGDSSDFYNNQILPGVMGTVSDFNECVVFDTRACLEQIRNLWKVRYNCAYRPCSTVLSVGSSFVGSFTGAATALSNDYLAFADVNVGAIISLAQFAGTALMAYQAAVSA